MNRHAAEVVARILGHAKLGNIIAPIFSRAFDLDLALGNLILEMVSGTLDGTILQRAEQDLENRLMVVRSRLGRVLSANTEPVRNSECSTCIRGALLKRWAQVAGDPGMEICDWLWQGAGAGAEHTCEAGTDNSAAVKFQKHISGLRKMCSFAFPRRALLSTQNWLVLETLLSLAASLKFL